MLETLIPGTNYSIGQLLFALLILAGGILVSILVRMSAKRVISPIMSESHSMLVQRILYYTIIIIALFSSLNYLRIDFTGALLAGGILGIIIGFATQSVISNLISGIFLQLEKPIAIGDPIRLIESNLDGVILETNIFSTTLRTFDGENLRVPNEKMFSSKIINHSKFAVRRVVINIGIAYREKMSEAIILIKEKMDTNPLVLRIPPPLVYVDSLGDSSVILSIRAWAPSSEWYEVRTQIVEQTKKVLDDAGIEIPFPQRVVWQAKE
jgi:small-conductance mechanosensitive channel